MDKKIIEHLVNVVGKEYVLSTPEDLAVYSYDGTFAESSPDVVVLPATTEQVSEVVKLAAEARIPIVTRGMGSGLAAGSIPYTSGGIVVSLTRMNHILEIDTENATVRTEAGVVTADLQAAVEKLGLILSPRSFQHPPLNHRREHRLQCGRTALPEIWRDRRLCAGSDHCPGRWADFENRRQAHQRCDWLRSERIVHRLRRDTWH